jgi:hypothetical protein
MSDRDERLFLKVLDDIYERLGAMGEFHGRGYLSDEYVLSALSSIEYTIDLMREKIVIK